MRRLRLENLELRDTVAIHELNQAIAYTLDPNEIFGMGFGEGFLTLWIFGAGFFAAGLATAFLADFVAGLAAGFDAGLAFDAVFLMATSFSCSTCRVSKIRIERGYPIASRYSTHPNRRQ